MPTGALTDDIDLIQVLLVAFFLFFGLLVIYLRREDKREGYPLVSRTARHRVIGWPAPPPPKTYRLFDGSTVQVPHIRAQPPLPDHDRPASDMLPLRIDGDPVLAELGAGAHVLRDSGPARSSGGRPVLVPLRCTDEWRVHPGELELRGMRVLARDYRPVGRVTELWIDRSGRFIRYLEVALDDDAGTILLPIFFAHIRQRDREIRVKALRVEHFPRVPRLHDPDIISAREEDRITAFYAGGSIYAEPDALF